MFYLQGFKVPWAGIEPALPKKLDFESNASTSSATKAFQLWVQIYYNYFNL